MANNCRVCVCLCVCVVVFGQVAVYFVDVLLQIALMLQEPHG